MNKINRFIAFFFITVVVISCKLKAVSFNLDNSIIENAEIQYTQLYDSIDSKFDSKAFIPRTITKNNKLRLVSNYDWTSGFYPGTLWYMYELTQDAKWKDRALNYTKRLDTIQYWKGNHDVGFIIGCSYGNALKHISSKYFDKVIVQTAKSLSTRFHPKAGIIQSWNKSKRWNCPVIIDNMMNLELLFYATKITGDSTYYNIAVSHADITMKNHYRVDNSSYHVLEYDPESGVVNAKKTAQGYADESAWARGQAWGLYGFTVCYRETKNARYLEQALKIVNFIRNHPELPEDKIPYWDYDVPKTENTYRDVSAAAITASALYELSTLVEKDKEKHISFANEILNSLSSPVYTAKKGTNKGFLLMHSVGSIPHKAEIDVPLNYADYYYLEALVKQKKLK